MTHGEVPISGSKLLLSGQKVENVEIQVSPATVYDAFLEHLRVRLFPDRECRPLPESSRDGVYIKNGVWEHWEDGHGSGRTRTLRPATQEEAEAMVTYDHVRQLKRFF